MSLLARQDTTVGTSGDNSSGGMTLPLLLAIAIGGGVLLFICLAFLLVALAGRRHRAAAAAAATSSTSSPASPSADSECCGTVGSRSPQPGHQHQPPRRLTKADPRQNGGRSYPTTYMDMVEIHEQQPHRSLASIMSVVPRGRGLFGTSPAEAAAAAAAANGNGEQNGGHRKNNSWIDEDAIHGPRMQKDERRLSIRDSFILRTPTLPGLLSYNKEEGVYFDGRFLDLSAYPPVQPPRPVSLPAQRGGHPPQRVPLPRTASYELAEKIAAAARGGAPVPPGPPLPPPGLGPGPGVRAVPVQIPLPIHLQMQMQQQQRLRHKTTESDLAEILRSTEERLQNGTPSNSRPTTRQRGASASAGSSVKTPRTSSTKAHGSPVKFPQGSPTKQRSPSKMGSPVKYHPSPEKAPSVRIESPVRNVVIHHVGQALDTSAAAQQQQQRTRTPSPHKRNQVPVLVQTPVHHRRTVSQSSAVSDADSLFGSTTPPETEQPILPTGLSSPSRRSDNESPSDGNKSADRCTSLRSLGSNASSSLSTLYSVNEPEDDGKVGGEGGGLLPRGRKPASRGLVIDTRMCDPFITPPVVPPRSPKRQASSLPPPLRRLPLPGEDNETPPPPLAPFNSKSASSSPVPRPLDVVKRSSTTRSGHFSIMMHPPDMSPSPEALPRPQSVTSMKPVFLVSSTSVASMRASPGTSPEDNIRSSRVPEMPNHRSTFGQRGIFPPPLNLRPASSRQASPNREALVMGSPGGGSPALRSVRDSLDSAASLSPSRPLPSPGLLQSEASSPGSRRSAGSGGGSPTPGRYKRRGMASPIRERVLSRQPADPRENRADRVLSSSDCPAIVLKPSDDSPKRTPPVVFHHRDFAVMGLQSTVAQLRRMNSQLSTLSASSTASGASDPDGGPEDSPTLPNMRGGGFSPERSNSRVSKIGRQNYLSLGMSPKAKRRAASIKGARNSIAVHKGRPGTARLDSLRAAAASARVREVVRGPRPLNPTSRSAGKGTRISTTSTIESPTRWRGAMMDAGGENAFIRRQSGKLDGGERLGVDDWEPELLRSSDDLAGGSNRNSANLRI